MKISVAQSSIFDHYGIEGGMKLLRDAGFDAIDFDLGWMQPWGILDQPTENHWETISEEELLAHIMPYKTAAAEYGLEFGQAHASYPTYHKTAEGRERIDASLKRQIMVCGVLDCPRLVFHPGYLYYNEQLSEEASRDANIALFSSLIPTLKQYRVTACLENTFLSNRGKIYEGVCSTAEEAIWYIDTLNEMAGEKCFAFCLDTGHSLMIGKDMRALIHRIGNRIEALHLNDNDGVDDLHTMPFTGKLDWLRTADALHDIGYTGTVNFELIMGYMPKELYPAALTYVAATGRYICSRIAGNI